MPGRPRKNGGKPMWMLERETLVLYAYGRARDGGNKHSVAISEAVKYIRDNTPTLPISETEVKRIVARWRSNRRPMCLVVTKPDPEHNSVVLPFVGRVRTLYTASVGPRPTYPRANAAKEPDESCPDR
jgi:hypothetical protein